MHEIVSNLDSSSINTIIYIINTIIITIQETSDSDSAYYLSCRSQHRCFCYHLKTGQCLKKSLDAEDPDSTSKNKAESRSDFLKPGTGPDRKDA